ncbi:DNA/RNA non-specific endonuclease [Veronia pacifica]|uniref:DNA/RNA endonuclease n=1 Tax=Veronia pacifica TaxID=1080227 RepID=A0A1C3ELD3_9GAMM|nr:DNA/RNA non-specific endonuclease [Veronia pacifica]ODA34041.1 DNA/RNA endonuclease [Veronia pacifica]
MANGYQENFLDGVSIPFPQFSPNLKQEILYDDSLREGYVVDYPNFSIVMNRAVEKRSAVFVALNIDQNLFKKARRIDNWRIDSRVGIENQLDNAYYANNPLDRGHLARRSTVAWGDSFADAQRASNETFYFTNAALQHANLNQDEWLSLESWVKALNQDKDGRITSFSGCIYGENDRTVRPAGRRLALVPAGFFKVVCFINMNNELDVRAFIQYQDKEALADKSASRRPGYNNEIYQVSLTEIEQRTGLIFPSQLYTANPLRFSDPEEAENNVSSTPERIEVAKPQDIISAGDQRETVSDQDIDIHIAAAMVNPKGTDAGAEWVSIINLGAETIDIGGWYLLDNSERKEYFPEKTLNLLPGESYVVRNLSVIKLANRGDVIKLYSSKGERVDWVQYTQSRVNVGSPVVFLSSYDGLQR